MGPPSGARKESAVSELKPFDFSLFTDRQLVDLLTQTYSEVCARRAKGSAVATLTELGHLRYRNPKNAAETWSGKGKMPGWVEEALAEGSDLASLEF
jgi:DNA-binding protein H-NS